MLMDLATLDWDAGAARRELRIPRSMLPEIRGSSEVYGHGDRRPGGRADRRDPRRPAGRAVRPDLLRGRRGQVHVRHGLLHADAHGRGAGPLRSTGSSRRSRRGSAARTRRPRTRWRGPWRSPVRSSSGCATTSGSSATRPRSRRSPVPCRTAATSCSCRRSRGLFAPHWRSDARGVIAGLTRFATKAHIARAALESTAYQVYDLGVAMTADLGHGAARRNCASTAG